MKNQLQKLMAGRISFVRPLSAGLLCALASCSMAVFAESYTGKIVIDGVVYGDSNVNIVKGSAVAGTDKRVVNNFHRVKIQGGIAVNYRPSQNAQVEVTGDQNLLPLITTLVHDGELVISSRENYQTALPLTVNLSSPNLEAVLLQGSGDVYLRELNEKILTLIISGSGNATLDGKTAKLTVQVSGSGDVNAKALQSEYADIQITGVGNINVTVTEALKAGIMGSGDITYFGHPKKVDPSILGSGDIVAGD